MSTSVVRWLNEVGNDDRSHVGGKAAGLGELIKAGALVPKGFVVTALPSVTEGMQKVIDEGLTAELLSAFDALNVPYVAVRSSAVAEDAAGASWAGQLETFLYVSREQFLARVLDCWNSADSARARAYAAAHGAAGGVAVVVQQMVASEVSGVAFSMNPVNGRGDEIVIEAGLGLGEAVVSGEITPDTYIVGKTSLEILSKDISLQTKQLSHDAVGTKWMDVSHGSAQKLDDGRIAELATLVKRLEARTGWPIDVEWAIADDTLFLLQCRPITTT